MLSLRALEFTQIVNDPPSSCGAAIRNHIGQFMHIPLTKYEIAAFLEIGSHDVELLWRTGVLERSLHCAYRPVPELSSSTVYDVLEYALAAGVLPATVSRELAALWVAQLAEADEWDAYQRAEFGERMSMMLTMAEDDGLAAMTPEAWKVAATLVAAQIGLVAVCCDLREAG